jgi:hypothetical protein
VFGSLRTEDFYNNVRIVLRIKISTTHKGEISLSNLSGYGLAILGATPNVSLTSHRSVGDDMRAVEALDHSRCKWAFMVTASCNFSAVKMSG